MDVRLQYLRWLESEGYLLVHYDDFTDWLQVDFAMKTEKWFNKPDKEKA